MFFLFRMLGLIRGLCTTLEVKLPYLEIMANYAQKGLVLSFERKVCWRIKNVENRAGPVSVWCYEGML